MEKIIKRVGNKNLELEEFFRTRNYNKYYEDDLKMELKSYLNVEDSSERQSMNFPTQEEDFSIRYWK